MAPDAEVENGTNHTTKSTKDLPSDMVDDADVGEGDGGSDETVKKITFQ